MRTLLLAAYVAGICTTVNAATPKMITVTVRNGVAYSSATEFERGAAIATKRLPCSIEVVACSEDRCTRVKGFLREVNVTLVNVAELATALGFAAWFRCDGMQGQLE